jgi:hypothetical protein
MCGDSLIGFRVSCNDHRYKFDLEDHGGKWSVKVGD